jgi:hypothetical protein
VIRWGRTGGRYGDGSLRGGARFFARPAGTQPFELHAAFCAFPDEHQESGPELQGVLEADSLRSGYDRCRRLMPTIRTTLHDAHRIVASV